MVLPKVAEKPVQSTRHWAVVLSLPSVSKLCGHWLSSAPAYNHKTPRSLKILME